MRKIIGTCKECNKPHWAKGYCRIHYERYRSRVYRANHPEYNKRNNERNRLTMRKKRENPLLRAKFIKKCREWRKNLKYEIFSHYSGEQPTCAKCGFADIRALCLDHINNDGAEHRRSLSPKGRGGTSTTVYQDLKKRRFPLGYQILCCNCNRIKEVENVVR